MLIEASPTIEDCIFENCKARVGGAIHIFNSSSATSPLISGCSFILDSVEAFGGYGGAISCAMNAQPEIDSWTFINNFGGDRGGAINVTESAGVDVQIANCLFNGNSAGYYGNGPGAAIRTAGKTYLSQSTFVKHTSNGGAVLSVAGANADVSFLRNIVAFNSTEGIRCEDLGPSISFDCNNFYHNGNGSFVGVYCDSTMVDSNTIFRDPLFCDTATDDYTISSWSPCTADSSKCGLLIGRFEIACARRCCDLPGDINDDGQGPDVADLNYLADYLFGGGPPPPCS